MISTLLAILIYLIVLVAIGVFAQKQTKANSEDYFMASRSLSKYILILAILGTQASAFTIMGLPGEAYRAGFGTLGKYAIATLGTGFGIYLFGYRAWLVGKRYGYSTSPQLVEGRFDSPAVNLLVLIFSLYYLVPYLLIGIMGGGQVVSLALQGAIPFWLSALIITAITVVYVVQGGMRGTAFTNVFQGVIMYVGIIIFVIVIGSIFGAGNLVTKIAAEQPHLLGRNYSLVSFLDTGFSMALAPMMFPQIIARLMASKSVKDLKTMSVAFFLGIIIAFALPILLGVWGAALVPGLQGTQSDSIIPIMISKFLGPTLAIFLSIVLLAAIASTLDGQLLSVSHLVTLDVIKRYAKVSQEAKVAFIGKIAVAIAALLAYIGALTIPGSIVVIAVFAFGGLTLMMWPLLLAFYWRRVNKWGYIVGVLCGQTLLHLWQFKLIPPLFGMNVALLPSLIIAMLLVVIVSLVTPQTENEKQAVDRYFSTFEKAFGISTMPNVGNQSTGQIAKV